MKNLTKIILLTVSLLIFSGCGGSKNYSLGGIQLPSFGEKKLDRSLPVVKELKAKTDMSKVALEWQPIKDKRIAGYRVFRGDNKNGFRLIATIKDRFQSHYVDKDLYQNINYTYKVSSYTNDGRVSMVSTAKIAKTGKKLSAPIILEASKNYPNRVKLIWKVHPDRVTDAYIVERKDLDKNKWRRVATLKDRLTVEYIDKDVKPAQKYSYRIRAKSYENVISNPSNIVKGFSKKLPNVITWVKATDNLPRMINLIWKSANAQKEVDHYNIYSSSLENSMFTLLKSTKETKFTDRFTSDGDIRYYKITSVDHDGLESPRSETKATLGATIGASRGPNITKVIVQANSISLEWQDLDGKARKYTVVKKYWDGWRAKKIKITDFKKTKFTDTKVKLGTKYTYYIIAVDKHGIESRPSKEVVRSLELK